MESTELGILVVIAGIFAIIILMFLMYREILHKDQLSLIRTEEGRLQLT